MCGSCDRSFRPLSSFLAPPPFPQSQCKMFRSTMTVLIYSSPPPVKGFLPTGYPELRPGREHDPVPNFLLSFSFLLEVYAGRVLKRHDFFPGPESSDLAASFLCPLDQCTPTSFSSLFRPPHISHTLPTFARSSFVKSSSRLRRVITILPIGRSLPPLLKIPALLFHVLEFVAPAWTSNLW